MQRRRKKLPLARTVSLTHGWKKRKRYEVSRALRGCWRKRYTQENASLQSQVEREREKNIANHEELERLQEELSALKKDGMQKQHRYLRCEQSLTSGLACEQNRRVGGLGCQA